MFVGHGLFAFALLALAGRAGGWDRKRVLSVAILAAVFGTLPDVDILYAPVGLLGGVSGVFDAAATFWQTGNVVHRTVTHSIPVGVVAAIAFGCWHRGSKQEHDRRYRISWRSAAVILLAALVVSTVLVSGRLSGIIMAAFVIIGIIITSVSERRQPGLEAWHVTAAALVGLVSHPFGDLFTGEPPALLYPFDVILVSERITLHPDPTLHLLGAFGLELLIIWLATATFFGLRGERAHTHLSPRATLGVIYAGAALALPAPTLETSYHFVFSILAVGIIGTIEFGTLEKNAHKNGNGNGNASANENTNRNNTAGLLASGYQRHTGSYWPVSSRRVTTAETSVAIVTGLAAVTLAGAGYLLVYLIV